MSMRSLPNWQTACRTEFDVEAPGTPIVYTGDCTQTSEWACFHTLDPTAWPNTAAALNSIVRYDQEHNGVGPTGAETAAQLASDLRERGVPFHQVFDASWENEIATWGGLKPMIVQVLHAGGNLPGDERGVNGHAIALLRWDPATESGWFCDGDHPAPFAPVPYTLAMLHAAMPFALTVIDREIGSLDTLDTQEGSVEFVKNADGSITYPAHAGIPGITLDHGQAYYASAAGSTRAGCYPLGAASYDPNGDSVVLWNDGKASRAVKANGWAIVLEDSGPRLAALLTTLTTEASTASTLSQQAATLTHQLADAKSQITALQAQVAQLQAQQQGGSSGSSSGSSSGGGTSQGVVAVRAAQSEVHQAVVALDAILNAPLARLTFSGLLHLGDELGTASDVLDHVDTLLEEAVATLDAPPIPPEPGPPTQPKPAAITPIGPVVGAGGGVSFTNGGSPPVVTITTAPTATPPKAA